MTSTVIYHYLYRITNLVEQKHYYGIRSSKNLLPQQDLGIKYFSSSTDKSFIKDQKEHPENYRYKIVIISNSRKIIANLEIKLHRKFNVDTNLKFYNKACHTSSSFSTHGRVAVRDENGNTFSVLITDPRYLSGEFQHLNKGMVNVKDQNGNGMRVSKNDPRWLSGELQHVSKGRCGLKNMVVVKDKNGNLFGIKNDDPRYLSGELQHHHKGKISVEDKEGNRFRISVDDPRYLSGELINIYKGRVTVVDKNGNRFRISVDDPRYLSGELQHINKGVKRIYNTELQKNSIIKPDEPLPAGWVYGRKKFN